MSLWAIVVKSLRQHWLSSLLAVAAIGLGASLLTAVFSLREQTYRNFTRVGLGVDAILGPKGSPLQVVLNGLYHLEDMPGKVTWAYYKAVAEHPLVAGRFHRDVCQRGSNTQPTSRTLRQPHGAYLSSKGRFPSRHRIGQAGYTSPGCARWPRRQDVARSARTPL